MNISTSSPKFIIPITGPLLKYRLDIIREVSPNIKDHLIIFTDKFSYNLYEEHHDFFNFVLMDDYRNNNSFSLQYELFPDFKTEEEFLKGFHSFYGAETGVYYPWEVHRFIFEYLIENNILNFVITQTDFIFYDNSDMMDEFFRLIPKGSLYMPFMGEEGDKRNWLWDDLQEKFKQIEFKYDGTLKAADGFLRGFNFHNIQDMQLFYDIWSEAIKMPITRKYGHITKMAYTDFIVPWLMQVFAKQKNYTFKDMHSHTFVEKYNRYIGRNITRPEDTLYAGARDAWQHHNFDYSNTSSIKNFIKNNKDELANFYSGTFEVTVTDNHIFTKLK